MCSNTTERNPKRMLCKIYSKMSSFASTPFGGGGGASADTCASTPEDLEFSCAANFGYEETSVCIDTNKRLGKGASKEVFLLTQCRDFASELKKFKLFKQVGSRPIDPKSYVMAIMSATTKNDLSEYLDEFFFSVEIHRCGIPMIKIHLCIVEIIFQDGTSDTITFDRNDYTVAGIDNSVFVKTFNANQAIKSAIDRNVKEYKVYFFEERGYELQTIIDSSEAAVNDFVRRVATQYLPLDFKLENILISLGNNNNNQLVLCDADKQFFIPRAELITFFNYDCSEGIIQYMLSLLYIDYYLYNKNRNHKLIALFGYLDDNKLKQQLLNPQFLLFLAQNMLALERDVSKPNVFTAQCNAVRYLAHYTELFDPTKYPIYKDTPTNGLYGIMRLHLLDVQPAYPHRDFYGALDGAFATMQMPKDVEQMSKNFVIHMLHCAFPPSPSSSSSSSSLSPYSLQASLTRIEQEFFERLRKNVDYLSTIKDEGAATLLDYPNVYSAVHTYKLNKKQNGNLTNYKRLTRKINEDVQKAMTEAMEKPKGNKVKKTRKGGKPRNKKTHKRSCKKTRRRSHF